MKVYSGAPQGCVLSPSDFTLYTSGRKNTYKQGWKECEKNLLNYSNESKCISLLSTPAYKLYSSTSKVKLLKY